MLRVSDYGLRHARGNEHVSYSNVDESALLYMAPELMQQVHGGAAADAWSYGCLLIHMATRRPPYAREHAVDEDAEMHAVGLRWLQKSKSHTALRARQRDERRKAALEARAQRQSTQSSGAGRDGQLGGGGGKHVAGSQNPARKQPSHTRSGLHHVRARGGCHHDRDRVGDHTESSPPSAPPSPPPATQPASMAAVAHMQQQAKGWANGRRTSFGGAAARGGAAEGRSRLSADDDEAVSADAPTRERTAKRKAVQPVQDAGLVPGQLAVSAVGG